MWLLRSRGSETSVCNLKRSDQVQLFYQLEYEIYFCEQQVQSYHRKVILSWDLSCVSHTTCKGDVQKKEYITINSNSNIIILMTTGTLVLLLLSVVKMSTQIVNPISNKMSSKDVPEETFWTVFHSHYIHFGSFFTKSLPAHRFPSIWNIIAISFL